MCIWLRKLSTNTTLGSNSYKYMCITVCMQMYKYIIAIQNGEYMYIHVFQGLHPNTYKYYYMYISSHKKTIIIVQIPIYKHNYIGNISYLHALMYCTCT